jgi:formylglycine-generating enzyme required for sulfatase activity
MVEVPAGEFIYQKEKATIDRPYMIDVYPVTNQQYVKFVIDGGYQETKHWSKEGQLWLKEKKVPKPKYLDRIGLKEPDYPVVGVSYYEAEAFAKWIGKRLPTEREWERAARGIDGRLFPWGDIFGNEKCNTEESRIDKTTPVTHYSNGISPTGCYDMAGNVWEWTASLYEAEKKFRVLRGGSWDCDLY